MIEKLIIWTFKQFFNRKNRSKLIEQCTIELYRQIALDELQIKCEIIKVKKGKCRYDLLFVEDAKGKRRIQISRHLQELHNNLMEVPVN